MEKDPDAAISWFRKAINEGDRVDSALKDMAVVMKQQGRTEEAIEAIKSCRGRCSKQAQESLDNILIDLYKKCGRLEEQIDLLKQKLWTIYHGEAFNGKPTKTARSHGKKFQVTIEQEITRILGNLGWAYMQRGDYMAAEVVYRKAQSIDPDPNKACNLCHCLIKLTRTTEARAMLSAILQGDVVGSDDSKSKARAQELLIELESSPISPLPAQESAPSIEDALVQGLDHSMKQWTPFRSKRLPVFEEISPFRDQVAC